jgi:hypothetical protein
VTQLPGAGISRLTWGLRDTGLKYVPGGGCERASRPSRSASSAILAKPSSGVRGYPRTRLESSVLERSHEKLAGVVLNVNDTQTDTP